MTPGQRGERLSTTCAEKKAGMNVWCQRDRQGFGLGEDGEEANTHGLKIVTKGGIYTHIPPRQYLLRYLVRTWHLAHAREKN